MNTIRVIVIGLALVVAASGMINPAMATLTVRESPDSGSVGMFVVENPNNVAVSYMVKWGSQGEWKRFTVHARMQRSPSYKLDANGRAPVPYLKFDNYGGDTRVTATEYRMQFARVTNGQGEGKMYRFQYAANGRSLDLVTVR